VKRKKRPSPALAALAGVLFGAVLLECGYRAALTARDRNGDVFELYAIGESSTAGEPYSRRLAFPSLAASMLDGTIGGRPILVENLAVAGDSIYPQAVKAVKRLRFRRSSNPAAVIIYSGHNEKFTAPREPGPVESAYLAFKNLVLYRSFLLTDLIVAGERAFQARGTRTLAGYERHMRRVIEAALDSRALPILATVASNQSGVEPTVACPDAEVFVATAPCRAALADFRRAQDAAARGRWDEAKALYLKAIDEDPNNGFGRATTEQNALLRRLAAEYRIRLVDAAALFPAASPHGITGNELMSDGHHPNMAGALLLARAFAAELSAAYNEPVRKPLTTPDQVFERFGVGPIDRAAALAHGGRWLLTVSVKHPSPAGRMALAIQSYEAALALTPDDQRLRDGLAIARANGDGKLLFEPAAIAAVAALSAGDGRLSAATRSALERTLRSAPAR
jgi:tetratricopeptide (TPR) repeat protein